MGVEELLIRSLLRTKQFDAAGEAANEVTEEDERAFYQALVLAAKGDHDAFAIAYRRCQDEYGYGPYRFIYDIDFPDGFAGWSRTFQPGPLRSLAVLLSEPHPIDPQSIIAAAADAWSQQLFEEDYPDIGEDDDHYVYRLTDNTCVLALDGYRLFVHSATGPFLGDASMLADKYDDALRENILAHHAWLHVDVDVGPRRG